MQHKTLAGLVAALTVLITVPDAFAAASRTFVSGKGADSGTCSVTAPCRSFAYAITQTSPSGEITVLDTAGYGTVTITKAISIVNPGGVEAGISAGSGATAITINAGANDKVALRGLSLEGDGVGQHGIVFNTGGSLNLADTVVRNFASDGITFTFQGNPGGSVNLIMKNVVSSDNNGSGIDIQNSSMNLYARLDHVSADHNGVDGLLFNICCGFTQVVYSSFSTNQSNDVDIEQIGIAFSQLSAGYVDIKSGAQAAFTGSTINRINNQGSCLSYGNNAVIFGVYGTACNEESPSVKAQSRLYSGR